MAGSAADKRLWSEKLPERCSHSPAIPIQLSGTFRQLKEQVAQMDLEDTASALQCLCPIEVLGKSVL